MFHGIAAYGSKVFRMSEKGELPSDEMQRLVSGDVTIYVGNNDENSQSQPPAAVDITGDFFVECESEFNQFIAERMI